MSGFSFGFSGDDIDIDDADIQEVGQQSIGQEAGTTSTLPELMKAQRHGMDDWLRTLPSQILYSKCVITSPLETGADTSANVTVARRDVFDIRAQLMVEDSAEEQNGELIAGLEKGDINPNFYEGGFKTWECSIDLGRLLVGEEVRGEDRHVVELGAGTAVPSLTLFAQLLSQTDSGSTEKRASRAHFTFADYNSAVLRLVTLPNLILTWNYFTTQRNTAQSSDLQDENQVDEPEEEMLDITPELLSAFQTDLAKRGITISFVSGAWSPTFVDLVFWSPELVGFKTLVLASETIYSPPSLHAFSETLQALLERPSAESRALVAAKKVYFGVGGGVDEFLAVLRTISESSASIKVEERLDVKSEGVGRTILEIAVGK
ncbi:hypothetical protein BJX63DRAFT_190860 [Aspergillus granulosus]|uniref:protein-histidine N-methyltransferase n=1 Tax=Aspergillus granulosus TaxID=176169 RepID=A0ABR4HHI7_9EURO